MISLEKSTPLIQFESSLQSPPNPFTEPSRSSPDSSFNSALHSANPGDFNDTPKPGFSTKQRQDTPFSWIDNSLPLSTGKVNLKNAFRKSLRKSLRKSKSAKAAIRKRSIYMVEVDDKASEGTDGTENEKVQVQAKIQVKFLEQFLSLLFVPFQSLRTFRLIKTILLLLLFVVVVVADVVIVFVVVAVVVGVVVVLVLVVLVVVVVVLVVLVVNEIVMFREIVVGFYSHQPTSRADGKLQIYSGTHKTVK